MNKILLSVLGILLLISCKQKPNSTKKILENQSIKDSLTTEINKLNKEYFNGLGTAIVDSSGFLYKKGFGFSDVKSKKPYTENTLQPIASVSKTFIGLALMKAQEKELLNLDDPINKYLPFKVQNPNFADVDITIRHLATHTSSIIDTENYINKSYVLNDEVDSTSINFKDIPQSFNPNHTNIPISEFLENYLSTNGKWYNKNVFTTNRPSQFFEYTNVGATLAAYIIEIVSNKSYADFTIEHILKPLEMNSSGWNYRDVNFENVSTLYSNLETELPHYSLITYPDGGFITNINDLGKYLTELIKGYSGNGTILTQESYKQLFKIQLTNENFTEKRSKTNPYDDEYNSGIFMGFSSFGNIGHTGGDPGVSSLMFFNQKNKIGRILFVNTNIQSQDGFDSYFGIMNKLDEYSNRLIE
ncbi:serine hydrolase domain-containing protein [Winogradskyella immobilis]|uniref:Beta-lactamase family protein n=1 Tax=Winogradskyella immobilis TaxID=2816852 RepID=A0ABS8EQS7_9FLAO|nr:serine hydrolase domain-containing protein [Winogradskyella immobilis]MCC1485533.1 beta-lactamase family protein [Winogradskyella immobilis]MCG0017625.1 beta-lactamase family protein [Winogradskyella immobilis]